MVDALRQKYATTFTIALFAVSTISGIALFFHYQPGWFHEMHEWLSMVLLLPVGLHAWRNWKSLAGYFSRKLIYVPTLLAAIAAVAFIIPQLGTQARGRNPMAFAGELVTRISDAGVNDLAPVLKRSPESVLDTLRARGMIVEDAGQTIAQIARSSNATPQAVLAVLLGPASR
jgi:Domain of unknown function (DUF4405)